MKITTGFRPEKVPAAAKAWCPARSAARTSVLPETPPFVSVSASLKSEGLPSGMVAWVASLKFTRPSLVVPKRPPSPATLPASRLTASILRLCGSESAMLAEESKNTRISAGRTCSSVAPSNVSELDALSPPHDTNNANNATHHTLHAHTHFISTALLFFTHTLTLASSPSSPKIRCSNAARRRPLTSSSFLSHFTFISPSYFTGNGETEYLKPNDNADVGPGTE